MSRAYYNEIDPRKAAWLRELIAHGEIAPGDVDERSITDVRPCDVAGYAQYHWFAGVGVWSYALRLAGWPDDRPVWTGSCPCPSFSAAGKGTGFDDPRHLWPDWDRLIGECRPPVLFGEQVSAAIRHGWLDLVQTDLEAKGYAVGKTVLGACSVGAPHIRQRLFFVAESDRSRCEGDGLPPLFGGGDRGGTELRASGSSAVGLLVNATGGGRGERRDAAFARSSGHPDGSIVAGELGNAGGAGLPSRECEAIQRAGRRDEGRASEQSSGASCGLEHSGSERRERREATPPGNLDDGKASIGAQGEHGLGIAGAHRYCAGDPGPVNGHWRDADWILCRDGKWRPVEAGTFPLAHGAPARVGRLRGYGDAIVAQAAAEVIRAYMEAAS